MYEDQLSFLPREEKPLVCFKRNELNWLLLTTEHIVVENEGKKTYINYSHLKQVSLAMEEELKDKVMNKEDFTRLILKDTDNKKYILKLEKGKPFQGIYQMLHHIISLKFKEH